MMVARFSSRAAAPPNRAWPFPSSEVVVLPDAGHYATNEAPIRTATEVNRFLAG